MKFILFIIVALFIILMIQIFEVYLTLKLNHDIGDELDSVENDVEELQELKNKVAVMGRALTVLKYKEVDYGRGKDVSPVMDGECGEPDAGTDGGEGQTDSGDRELPPESECGEPGSIPGRNKGF